MSDLPLAQLLMLAALPVLLAASGLFSGSETALFSLSAQERRRLQRGGSLAATALRSLLADTRALLVTLLLGNMVVNVLYFVLSTLLLLWASRRVGGWALAGLSVASLLALILAGEVLPKLVAARLAWAWASLVSVPLLALHRLLAPLRVAVVGLIVTPLARLIAPRQTPNELTVDELAALLEMSEARGLIDPGEEQLLQQVLALRTLKVRDLMVPRVDIRAFDLREPPQRLIDLIVQTGLSAIPVFRRDLDEIDGVVFTRQVLLRRPRTLEELRPLIRRVMFVPELQRADDLLLHLRKTGTTMAIAVDEYGGTAGLVTLEDVVEQMVGHIAGPYERSGHAHPELVGLGVWRVSGQLSVHDWTAAFGAEVVPAGVSTLGGLVMTRLGRLPRVGDRTRVGNLIIEVERMTGRRVDSLVLRLANLGAPGSAGTPDAAAAAGPASGGAPAGRGATGGAPSSDTSKTAAGAAGGAG